MGKRFIDVTGKRFGMLTAISSDGAGRWYCECDCGRMRRTSLANLRSGRVRSCGCDIGRPAKFQGCDDDCFNCKYKDCLKPDYMCKSTEGENDNY